MAVSYIKWISRPFQGHDMKSSNPEKEITATFSTIRYNVSFSFSFSGLSNFDNQKGRKKNNSEETHFIKLRPQGRNEIVFQLGRVFWLQVIIPREHSKPPKKKFEIDTRRKGGEKRK